VNHSDIREEIIRVGRLLHQKGFISASDGNISVRLDDDRIITTPTGLSKGFLTKDQLVVIDMKGKKVSGSLNPSSEILMHLCVYEERKDVKAVVHAHPPISTAFSIAGVSLAKCILPEVVCTLGAIHTTDYATPGTHEVPQVIRELIKTHDALILDRHGTLTVGKELFEAYMKVEKVEHTAAVTLAARQLGNVRLLPDEEVGKLEERCGIKAIRSESHKCVDCNGCGLSEPGEKDEDEDELVKKIYDEVKKEMTKVF
jgi:L-fuculose-phosphate aldolase